MKRIWPNFLHRDELTYSRSEPLCTEKPEMAGLHVLRTTWSMRGIAVEIHVPVIEGILQTAREPIDV